MKIKTASTNREIIFLLDEEDFRHLGCELMNERFVDNRQWVSIFPSLVPAQRVTTGCFSSSTRNKSQAAPFSRFLPFFLRCFFFMLALSKYLRLCRGPWVVYISFSLFFEQQK